MTDIGKKITTLRKMRKLTQQELADRLELTRATISNYETGRRSPHLNELQRIADFFGVGLDHFGIVPTDEVLDLLARAKKVFESEHISEERKNELFEAIMRLKLHIK